MALITYILLLYFLNNTLGKKCVINNTPDYITWEEELVKDLECGYDSLRAPSENTIVNITYLLESFNFGTEKKVMILKTWMNTMWIDERLKWDPEKHHGIKEADVSIKYKIWTPYFKLSEYTDFLDTYMPISYFALKSNGEVTGQHLMLHQAWCVVKLTNWPYDVQECSYGVVAKESYSKTGNFTINYNFIVQNPNGAEWYLYDYKNVEDNSTKRQTKFTFFLVREAEGLSAIVICPALILTVLSVLSLCLDVRRKVRLSIISFSLLGHYYFLRELAFDIPKESHFPPTLLLYYRGSVILSVIIIFLTFVLAVMCKFKSTPHSYVKQVNNFVYENKYSTYLVYPRWDFDDVTVDIKPSSEDWVKFANIVNSVSIFCVVFAYIGLYAINIPKYTHYDKDQYDNFYL